MEKKQNKVVEFIKTHKAAITLAAGAAAGIVIWAITKDKSSNYIDIERPSLPTGAWTNLTKAVKGKFKDCVSGAAIAVDVADLGKFGESLVTIDGIDEHEPIRIVFGTEKSFI